MPDPTPIANDWVWRAASAAGSAIIAAGTTIFATRKNNEASVLASVNKRIDAQFNRLEAEIERLEREMETERASCARQLSAMQAEIDRLMGRSPAIPPYSTADIEHGQRTVRDVLARKRGKT